jgi:exopolysaccharide biosynthesis polyprenyl glycosylphosphotransferase
MPAVLRRLDERFSGLTVLLVSADVLAFVTVAVVCRLPWHFAVVLGVFQLVARVSARVYRRRLRMSYFDDLPRSLSATATGFGIAAATMMLFFDVAASSVSTVLRAMAAFVVTGQILHALVFQLARWARRRFARGERTAVLGASPVGIELFRNMVEHPEFGLRPIGFIDPLPPAAESQLPGPLLTGDIAEAVVQHRLNTVILAFTGDRDTHVVDTAMTAHRLGCSMLVVPRLFELYHDAADVERLRSYPLVRLTTDPTRRPAWLVKRAFDLLMSIVLLVLLAPVLLLCGLAVLVESGRPIIFTQERIGLDGSPFRIYKLRSLRPATSAEARTLWSIADDPRVGPVGRFLRRTSLDELPQLWNIVRGEMSFVGPRPERPTFVEQFSLNHERYWARHRVPSGLTGLAQVNGLRGDTSIADRARYDNYYIANWSLWLDLKIVLLTGHELLRRGNH